MMGKFHLIGIKGAGMSSLACMLKDFGHIVQGSDVSDYFFTIKQLEEKNIDILNFNENNIDKDSTIIVGNAFNHNEEHEKAKQLECEIYTYYEYLGNLSKNFYSIAVSGSHGKTTTTNLIRQILEHNDKINYLIGDGQGCGNNQSDLFVFEACEYKRHFLYYYPKIAVITNIDYDHPDYYLDIYDSQDAFKQFINQSEIVVYNGDDLLLKEIINKNKLSMSYGLNKQNDFYAENISNNSHHTHFDLYHHSKFITNISIPLFGIHSVYNALAAITATYHIIKSYEIIKNQLLTYRLSKRRFEEYIADDQILISDYAHHPKEIKAAIEAASSKYPFKKIILYFQPHTYSRTITFLHDFADSLALAHRVYLREIFSSAREKDETININDLSLLIEKSKVINDETYIEEFKQYKDCVIIFMGAGDIDKYFDTYVRSFK